MAKKTTIKINQKGNKGGIINGANSGEIQQIIQQNTFNIKIVIYVLVTVIIFSALSVNLCK